MTFLPTRPARSAAMVLSLLCLPGALAAAPAAASAGTPATVTVRVEDFGKTLLAQRQLTTTTANVFPDGQHACSGTSAGGALWDATGGQWQGLYSQTYQTYEVDTIDGVSFPANFSGDAYWALWVNGTYAQSGLCGQELNPGDDVVLFAQCQAVGPDCTSATAPDHFLTETGLTATTVQARTPVSLTVGSVGTGSGAAEALPAGVVVSATPSGAATATPVSVAPNAQGVATVTISTAGTYALQATASDSVPSDPLTVCVHNGDDGNCGTTAPPSTTAAATTSSTATTATTSTTTNTTSTAGSGVKGASVEVPAGPAVAAFASSVLNSHFYAAGHGPRTLAGHVTTTGTLEEVRLRLTRNDHGRCSYYDGVTERFHPSRCGVDHGTFFDIGVSETFSYLLPSRLGPGRYVFDIEAVDTAGHVSALYHGTSRIVFYVK